MDGNPQMILKVSTGVTWTVVGHLHRLHLLMWEAIIKQELDMTYEETWTADIVSDTVEFVS